MSAEAIVHRVFDHVEANEIDKAVLACLRLARLTGDTYNAVIFLRETYPDLSQLRSGFFDLTSHLSEKQREWAWKRSQDEIIEEHTLGYAVNPDNPEANVLAMGAGELMNEIQEMEREIQAMQVPSNFGEFDAAAFQDRYDMLRSRASLKIRACRTVLDRIRTRCHLYAIRVEQQLTSAKRTSEFVGNQQKRVQDFYASRDQKIYERLRKADALVESPDPEDHALLLTTIRRTVRAVADHHYPPREGEVICGDGKSRKMGEEQYLNRLQEFCSTELARGSAAKLLVSELEHLGAFLRRLHDVASKGVHSEVSPSEARQGLLGVYMFLSNIVTRIEAPEDVGGDI